MSVVIELSTAQLDSLARRPSEPVAGSLGGAAFRASVAIPHYLNNIRNRYAAELAALGDLSLAGLNDKLAAGPLYDNFGLVIEFAVPTTVQVHDAAHVRDPSLGMLMSRFGPLILRNASLHSDLREQVHKNIFPSLRFHTDRGRNQDNQISLFTRDPDDAEHIEPRTSSTLFIANVVAFLEQHRLNSAAAVEFRLRLNYDLFEDTPPRAIIGDTVLEQPWKAPRGVGELCLIDNRDVLHASYHHDIAGRGWRIGARYLLPGT